MLLPSALQVLGSMSSLDGKIDARACFFFLLDPKLLQAFGLNEMSKWKDVYNGSLDVQQSFGIPVILRWTDSSSPGYSSGAVAMELMVFTQFTLTQNSVLLFQVTKYLVTTEEFTSMKDSQVFGFL